MRARKASLLVMLGLVLGAVTASSGHAQFQDRCHHRQALRVLCEDPNRHGEFSPLYEVLYADGPYELRRYRPLLLASVIAEGTRREAMGRALNALRAYVSRGNCPVRHPAAKKAAGSNCTCNIADGTGRRGCPGVVIDLRTASRDQPSRDWERGGPAVRMSTPVIQTRLGPSRWSVSFILQDEYTLATVPQPHARHIVSLSEWPAGTRAVQRLRSIPNEGALGRKTAGLLGFIARYDMEPTGPAQYAIYNPPWALFPVRRDEVLMEVDVPERVIPKSGNG